VKKPLIGIAPYHIKRQKSFWNATKEDYYFSVWEAGACPVTLNHPPNKKEIPNIVNQIDAFLMVGGPDIPASIYGSENPNLIDEDQMSEERESFDRLVFLETMKQNKKVLAICLGMQHANVVLGGTLTEDIPTLVPGAIDHGKFNGKHSIHSVQVEKESLLFDILGSQTISVASTHHQAIKKLGNKAKTTARSDDGVIEAIEIKNKNNFIGVQWHPELLKESKTSKKIFSWLQS
tara:strand:- start:13084 stop:13785 length:702 start_codon:yes stop_codon:yes gene_type:complete